MKRILFGIVSFLLFSSLAFAGPSGMMIGMGGAGAPGGECTATTPAVTGSSDGSTHVSQFNASEWRATKWVYGGTGGLSVCQVDLWVQYSGTPTDGTYYVAILDGTSSPTSVIGTSQGVDLGGLSSETLKSFVFTVPSSSLTNGATYWVALYRAQNAADYALWHYVTGTTTQAYRSDGGAWTTGDDAYGFKFEVYVE